jgi:aromatic-L-amino-acid decarboxylase
MLALAHRMLDDMLEYMKTLRDRPAWRHAPSEVKAHFERPLPVNPQVP